MFALQQFRHIAGVFDILDAALQFAQGVAEHLAVLGGDQLADGIGVLLQQILSFIMMRARFNGGVSRQAG